MYSLLLEKFSLGIMKRFLVIALTGVLLSPITARSESFKLLVKVNQHGKISTSVLTMASEKACKEGKKKVLQNSEWRGTV